MRYISLGESIGVRRGEAGFMALLVEGNCMDYQVILPTYSLPATPQFRAEVGLIGLQQQPSAMKKHSFSITSLKRFGGKYPLLHMLKSSQY